MSDSQPTYSDQEALNLGLLQAYAGGDYLNLELVRALGRSLMNPSVPMENGPDLAHRWACSQRFAALSNQLGDGEFLVGVYSRKAWSFATIIHSAATLAVYEVDPAQSAELSCDGFFALGADATRRALEP